MLPWSGIFSRPFPSAETASDPQGRSAGPAGGAVRIRLTAAGALAVTLLLGAGIVAVNSGNNLLYLVVSSLLALLALSGLLGHANLRGVGLRLKAPEEAWAGRPVSVTAEITSHRRRLPAFLLALQPSGDAGSTVLEIPAGGRADVAMTLTFAARGRQSWPDCEVSSEFPFGLIRRAALVRPAGGCLVYPAPIAVPWESVERAEREGELLARAQPGIGGDYRGLRNYIPGDSLARVHWSTWLRLRRLLSKEFETEAAPPVVYAFDAVPGPGTEERLGQLAWLVRTAARRGRSVGLELPGRTVAPGTGAAHRRELLAALALFGKSA